MKKIKVFLRLGKNPHPIYHDLIRFPPNNIIYKYPPINLVPDKKPDLIHKLKIMLWSLYLKKRPPIVKINPHGCDLIHSTNNIMSAGKTPWIMDVESLSGLFGFNPAHFKNKKYFSRIKKTLSSKYCKKLMPYTLASKLSMVNGGLKEIEHKMQVLHPVKKAIPRFKKKKNKIPKVLWAGRRFWEKGGNTVLQVFDKTKGKAKFELIMLGPVPEKIKEKYENCENISFIENKSLDNILWEKFQEADIFIYPTNIDSFGLAMIDAMNHRLPIITSDTFSAPEIVENGKNGFAIKHPMKWHDEKFQRIEYLPGEYLKKLENFHDKKYINELSKKLLILVKNKNLREKMGETGYKEVLEGKFSIKKKNEELEKIYKNSVKKPNLSKRRK